MNSRTMRQALLACAVALAGCAQHGVRVESPTLVRAGLVYERTADGRELLLIREYYDDVKLPGGEERWRVQYLWDYANGVAVQRIFNNDGSLQSLEPKPALTLNATEAELAFAIELVKHDVRIAPHLTADATYYGGFSFREPDVEACNMRSRCVHVFAVRDEGQVRLVHAIVDLMTARVVIPDYDHDLKSAADAATKKGNDT